MSSDVAQLRRGSARAHRTVAAVRAAVRADRNAPLGLLYWLEHVPSETNWLDAPRPAWLAYLARLEGLIEPSKLDWIDEMAVKAELEAEFKRDGTYPLVTGAAALRMYIEDIR